MDGIVNRYYTVDGTIELLTVEKEGYTFKGWFENADFSGERVTAIDASKAENKELFAKFEINTYTVTLKNGNETLNTESVDYGKKVDLTTPEVEGYTFEGWYTDEACTIEFNADTVIKEDTTLYAKLTANATEKSGCGKKISEIEMLLVLAIGTIVAKRRLVK